MIQTSFQHERYRALAFLADNPDGCTRAIMLGLGFPEGGVADSLDEAKEAFRAAWERQCPLP